MYIAKGNTYQAKDALNKIGFVWNREAKRWESDKPDFEAWEKKYCNPTWNGRRAARINIEANITFEQI